jgi:hypothetical protein
MELADLAGLLAPEPLALETGFERLPDGSLHVAVRTDMPGCTGEMLEWWFRWRCETREYVWWHPVDHVFSGWQGTLSADTHVGSEHIVTERLADLPAEDLVIQFRSPEEFFDPTAYELARKRRDVACAVLGRIGFGHDPSRAPDGRVLGGRLLHVGRDTGWGLALRSHFFLGTDLPAAGRSFAEVEQEVTVPFGRALLEHAYSEFTFLSRFLPSLYIAENRDRERSSSPW